MVGRLVALGPTYNIVAERLLSPNWEITMNRLIASVSLVARFSACSPPPRPQR